MIEEKKNLPVACVENYGTGYIIADYALAETVRYRGKSDNWVEGHPFVEDPFETEKEAEDVLITLVPNKLKTFRIPLGGD